MSNYKEIFPLIQEMSDFSKKTKLFLSSKLKMLLEGLLLNRYNVHNVA